MVLLSPVRIAAITLPCLLLASCESKISQCQRIIKVHNQVVLDTQKLTSAGTKGDLKIVSQSVAVFAQGAKTMNEMEVRDDKLTELKNQLATMYDNSSKVTQQILDSQAKKKNSEVAQGRERLSQVASPEKNLVSSINSYCSGGDAPASPVPSSSSPATTTSPAKDKNKGN
jgi:hypothetical protein